MTSRAIRLLGTPSAARRAILARKAKCSGGGFQPLGRYREEIS